MSLLLEPTLIGGTSSRWITEAEPTAFGEEHELKWTNEILSGESQGRGEDEAEGEGSLLERETLDEIAKCQEEQEEKERKAEEEQEEKKKEKKEKVCFVVTVQSHSSAHDSCGNAGTNAENQANINYQPNINSQEGGQGQSNSRKEQESGQSGEPGGQDPGRDNGGGKKSDNEDEDGNQTDEKNDSGEDSSNKKNIKTLSEFLGMALLNVHSIKNKQLQISDLLVKHNVQVFFLTETWLKPYTGGKALKFFFRDFKSFQKARKTRGGGVAVLFSGALEAKQLDSSLNTPLEYLVTWMHHETWDQPILTITLYRPQRCSVTELLEVLQKLLDKFSDYNSIIVTGDFNIWVDDETKEPVRRFIQFLDDNGLRQHVEVPTFYPRKGQKAHTLDLVISKNVEISDLHISDERVSDHRTILFSARPLSREEKEEEERRKDQDKQKK